MRFRRFAVIAAFLLAPAVVVSLAMAVLHATLADVRPSWNDDVNYWNEISCFAHAGFGAGYCVVDERIAPAKWTRYGPHGPAFAMLYGLPARFVGWHAASGPFFNLVVLALGAVLWIWLAKPDSKQLATATLLSATFWPVILHIPATYQDTLHGAIAFVLAGLAQRELRGPGSLRSFWPFLVGVALASMIRITWALVLIPWAITALPGKRWYSKGIILLATACTIPTLTLAWGAICSPFGDELSGWAASAKAAPMSTFWNLEYRWEQQWAVYLLPSAARPVGMLQRYEIMAVFVIGAGMLIFRKHPRAGAFAALNLFVVLAPIMLIYGTWDWRDYRVLFPHMLLALLVLLAADYRLALPFVVANLLFIGPFLGQFEDWNRQRLRPDIAAPFREAVAHWVEFDPAAGPWANTILVPVDLWSPTLEGLPPGIGATMSLHDEWLKRPVRSRWVLLHGQSPERYGRLQLKAVLPVEADPPTAELYLNLNCPDETP